MVIRHTTFRTTFMVESLESLLLTSEWLENNNGEVSLVLNI